MVSASLASDLLDGPFPELAVKAPVRAATTAQIALFGLQTVDGVVLDEGDRVLVKNQADRTTNGIYYASASVWRRASDANGARDFTKGTRVVVGEGTANSLKTFVFSGASNPVVGVDDLTFVVGTAEIDAQIAQVIASLPGLIAVQLQDIVADGNLSNLALNVTSPTRGLVVQDSDGDWLYSSYRSDALLASTAAQSASSATRLTAAELVTSRINPSGSSRFAIVVEDQNGDWISILDQSLFGSSDGGSGEDVNSFSRGEIEAKNARALSLTDARRAEYDGDVTSFFWDYTTFHIYGQSLSAGAQGFPALSRTIATSLGLKMLGNAERGAHNDTTFTPVGTTTLNPLAARDTDGTGAVMSQAAVAALDPDDGTVNGESPAIAAMIVARKLFLAHFQKETDAREWVIGNCGRGGQTLANLSKPANTWYNRLASFTNQVKSIATGASKTSGYGGLLWLQGEADVAITSKADYKAGLKQLLSDIKTDVATGVFGQAGPPVMVTYQTGGVNWSTDTFNIQMAQWELSEEEPHWHLASPTYYLPDKNGHLTSNGYRWLGCHMGKVLFRTCILREGWAPLSPIVAEKRGLQILVQFYTMHPPLIWLPSYVARAPVMLTNKGFYVRTAANVAVGIDSVEIVGDALVMITLTSDTTEALFVDIARKSGDNGNCNLADSDPTIAPLSYVYTPGIGQAADENIPELVGKPYPMNNRCVACTIPVVNLNEV